MHANGDVGFGLCGGDFLEVSVGIGFSGMTNLAPEMTSELVESLSRDGGSRPKSRFHSLRMCTCWSASD